MHKNAVLLYSRTLTYKLKNSVKMTLAKIYFLVRWILSVRGAVITLTLSIVAAIAVFFIQDAIRRQRYLELLQLELRSNYNSATVK